MTASNSSSAIISEGHVEPYCQKKIMMAVFYQPPARQVGFYNWWKKHIEKNLQLDNKKFMRNVCTIQWKTCNTSVVPINILVFAWKQTLILVFLVSQSFVKMEKIITQVVKPQKRKFFLIAKNVQIKHFLSDVDMKLLQNLVIRPL